MKRNNIELNDLNNKSENLIEEINYKIAELLEMNPDYKVILHNIKIEDWNHNLYESNTRIMLTDTY